MSLPGGIPDYSYIIHQQQQQPQFRLKDIELATNNFAEENVIETNSDCTWTVYKGELSGKKLAFITIRRYYIDSLDLDVLNELTKHQNIVSIFGSCDKDYTDRILVLEHPTRGGLDKYVSSTEHLTWLTRLKICLDIASGLDYLQNHPKELDFHHECLTSASIHLDENWQAKIQLITPRALASAPSTSLRLGKLGYVDPLYMQSGRRQSEIYSVGVILFELLCARPAVTYDEERAEQFLSKLACSHYEKGTLTEIIDPVLWVQMNRDSFTVFSELAYRCLSEDLSIRPTISAVIEQLQIVLKLQGFVNSEFKQYRHSDAAVE